MALEVSARRAGTRGGPTAQPLSHLYPGHFSGEGRNQALLPCVCVCVCVCVCPCVSCVYVHAQACSLFRKNITRPF